MDIEKRRRGFSGVVGPSRFSIARAKCAAHGERVGGGTASEIVLAISSEPHSGQGAAGDSTAVPQCLYS